MSVGRRSSPPIALRTAAKMAALQFVALGGSSVALGGFPGCFLTARLFGGEFKTNFAILQFKVSREWPAFLRDKFVEQVGLAGGDEFLHLLFRNFTMQNGFTDAESAGFRRS